MIQGDCQTLRRSLPHDGVRVLLIANCVFRIGWLFLFWAHRTSPLGLIANSGCRQWQVFCIVWNDKYGRGFLLRKNHNHHVDIPPANWFFLATTNGRYSDLSGTYYFSILRWVLLIRFVRFSIYLWVQSVSFWGSDAGIVTDKADSMRQRETKRWQNVNPQLLTLLTVGIYRTHLNRFNKM